MIRRINRNLRHALTAWLDEYGYAAIAFGKASALNLAATVLIIWAILTSGHYFAFIAAVVGLGGTAWMIITFQRVYRCIVRGRYKTSATDHDRRSFGFWLGAFVSLIGLLWWTFASLRNIDI